MYYVFSFLIGSGAAFFYTAKMSVVPNIVESNDLKFANAINSAIGSIALLFGALKCISVGYPYIDINNDGIFWLKELGISTHIYRVLPYLITIIVLAFTSKKSRAPKAEGQPYDKGKR